MSSKRDKILIKKILPIFNILKKTKNKKLKRKNYELKTTPGKDVRDAIIKARLGTVQEFSYVADNNTNNFLNIAESFGHVVDLGTELIGGGESVTALGKIAFKITKDITRGDTICTVLYLLSGTCESIALCCSTKYNSST